MICGKLDAKVMQTGGKIRFSADLPEKSLKTAWKAP
jgi:hypothetical protein